MACTIRDSVVRFDQSNVAVPIPRATILVKPSQTPLFIEKNTEYLEVGPVSQRVISSLDDGTWSVVLPWPSEQDPTTSQWIFALPDGSVWMGHIPEGIAGPLTLHDLKQSYGLGLVSATNQEFKPYAVQGATGAKGDQGIQGIQGPSGPGFGSITSVQTSAYLASVNDLVRADPSDGTFNVTLPTAVSAGPSVFITVKNISLSVNVVTVVFSGGDLSDGDSSVTLASNEAATFVSDGISSWMRM